MRNSRNRKTFDLSDEKYSTETIRKYEDPEYARRAAEYERQAKMEALMKNHREEVSNENMTDLEDYLPQPGRRHAGRKTEKKRKKKYRIRFGTVLRNIIVFLLILCIAGTAYGMHLTKNFTREEAPGDLAINSYAADELKGYRNIAILGSDARADEGYDGSRTDAIIIMSIKKSNGDIRLISVMRDSYMKMGYFNDEPIMDKITHAYHYTGGRNTVEALNRTLDLNIKDFVVFNWKSVADTVDCLGGIKIKVNENEVSDMNIWGNETGRNVGRKYHRIEKAGVQELDGVQAVTYCRIRKNSGGDSGRSVRYKKVVKAVMKEVATHPWKAKQLSEEVFPNIRTNMSSMDILTAAIEARGFDMKKSISWPKDYYSGLLSDGVSYVVPITLESNVQRLHRLAFGQENYVISDTCREINDQIIYETGLQ